MIRKKLTAVALIIAVMTLFAGVAACGDAPVVKSLSISGEYKTSYVEGQSFDAGGMVVTAVYSDGTSKTVTDFAVTPSGALALTDDKITVTYEGSTATANIAVAAKAAAGIAVTTPPGKTDYIAGQLFDKTEMVVTATYNDGSTAVVTDYTVLPEDALKSVDKYVLISYRGKTAEQPVKVTDKKVTGIAITAPPKKTEYIEGQLFDAGGMVVTATYNDGTSLPIHAYSVSRDPLSATDTSVTISYEGHTATQPITVIAKAETGIAITTPPTATAYVEGQTFDPAGMVVSATYNDGTTAPVTGYTITPDRALATTDITVTVEYEGHTATQAITVAAKVVTDIEITTPPAKVNYIEGQVFEKEGMVVTATYNDGTEAPITDYTVPAEALAVGTTAITVTYEGKTATQAITVAAKKMTGIAITKKPAKTDYIAGQAFDTEGMIVTAAYDNGTTAPVTGYKVTPAVLAVGDEFVTIALGDFTAQQAVNVVAKTVTRIEITTAPTKTTYIAGEKFDPAGMVVTATYSDNSTGAVAGYTIDPTGPLTLDTTFVTIGYEAKTVTQSIVVKADITKGGTKLRVEAEELTFSERQKMDVPENAADAVRITSGLEGVGYLSPSQTDTNSATYTFSSAKAGKFTLRMFMAHGSYVLDDRMTLIVNDNIVPTGYTFHGLGGSYSWWPWQWVTVENLDLLSGTNSVTFKFISKDNAPNFDRFEIVVTEYDGAAATIDDITLMDGDCVVQTRQSGSYKVESEWFDYSSCTVTGGKGYVESADAGGGKYVGPAFAVANNKIRLHIWVDEAATMSMDLRMALTGGSAVNDILTCKVNDSSYEWASDTTFTSTSATDWNNIVLGDITLKAGINTVVLETKTATIPNIDYGTFNITFA